MTIKPDYLSPGSKVAIIPPANAIRFDQVEKATEILNSWNLETVLSQNIKSRYFRFAGEDHERLTALQSVFDDPELKAIFCARGGYGTSKIIDDLDLYRFKKHPKWVIGYSDITVLLNTLLLNDFQSIHGPMPLNFCEDNAEDSLRRLYDLLFGKPFQPVEFQGNGLNRPGKAEATLVGGNLTMINNCLATASDLQTDNRILFLEDVDEHLYRIERMLVQMKRARKLDNLAGMIIGHFTRMEDNSDPFGKTIPEILLELTREFDYPVCFGAPIGHEMPNYALPVGRNMKLEVDKESAVLTASTDN